MTENAKIEILSHTFPTLNGEKALLKIQYKRGVTHSLDQLGMTPEMLAQYKAASHKINGLIIVAGPPGNGKTSIARSFGNLVMSPNMYIP